LFTSKVKERQNSPTTYLWRRRGGEDI